MGQLGGPLFFGDSLLKVRDAKVFINLWSVGLVADHDIETLWNRLKPLACNAVSMLSLKRTVNVPRIKHCIDPLQPMMIEAVSRKALAIHIGLLRHPIALPQPLVIVRVVDWSIDDAASTPIERRVASWDCAPHLIAAVNFLNGRTTLWTHDRRFHNEGPCCLVIGVAASGSVRVHHVLRLERLVAILADTHGT